MEVAVKIMLFQNTVAKKGPDAKKDDVLTGRQLVLREAAVCCSMCHPNVVATYHYEVLKASAFHVAPSGLEILDNSDEKSFKLYLIQVHTYRELKTVKIILIIVLVVVVVSSSIVVLVLKILVLLI